MKYYRIGSSPQADFTHISSFVLATYENMNDNITALMENQNHLMDALSNIPVPEPYYYSFRPLTNPWIGETTNHPRLTTTGSSSFPVRTQLYNLILHSGQQTNGSFAELISGNNLKIHCCYFTANIETTHSSKGTIFTIAGGTNTKAFNCVYGNISIAHPAQGTQEQITVSVKGTTNCYVGTINTTLPIVIRLNDQNKNTIVKTGEIQLVDATLTNCAFGPTCTNVPANSIFPYDIDNHFLPNSYQITKDAQGYQQGVDPDTTLYALDGTEWTINEWDIGPLQDTAHRIADGDWYDDEKWQPYIPRLKAVLDGGNVMLEGDVAIEYLDLIRHTMDTNDYDLTATKIRNGGILMLKRGSHSVVALTNYRY